VTIKPGLAASARYRVNSIDLADKWGGRASALASPIMIIFIEKSCMLATDHLLAPQQITVGYDFQIKHLAPTPPDWEVDVSAELTSISGPMMTYKVAVRDEVGLVGEGTHTRCIVDNDAFHARLADRCAAPAAAARNRTAAGDGGDDPARPALS
jgi:fluoroacetyl-CoA thioesterase